MTDVARSILDAFHKGSEPSLPVAVIVALWAVFDAWLVYGAVQHVIWTLD